MEEAAEEGEKGPNHKSTGEAESGPFTLILIQEGQPSWNYGLPESTVGVGNVDVRRPTS